MSNRIAWRRANWMDRADIVKLLESVGIACYDRESTDELRQTLVENVDDGTIDLDQLPETDGE